MIRKPTVVAPLLYCFQPVVFDTCVGLFFQCSRACDPLFRKPPNSYGIGGGHAQANHEGTLLSVNSHSNRKGPRGSAKDIGERGVGL